MTCHGDRVVEAEGPAFVFVAVDQTAEYRSSCRQARDPLRPGAVPGHPGTLRGHRRRRGPWAGCVTTTGRTTWPTSTGGRVLRYPKFPELRAGARRQRRRERFRTLKENLLWVRFATIEELRLALLVQADIQRTVDAGEIRLSKPRPGATRPRRAGRGSVEANTVTPLSKNPGAVHGTPAPTRPSAG